MIQKNKSPHSFIEKRQRKIELKKQFKVIRKKKSNIFKMNLIKKNFKKKRLKKLYLKR